MAQKNKLFFLGTLFVAMYCLSRFFIVHADTSSTSATVNATVSTQGSTSTPNPGIIPGGIGPGSGAAAVISDVVADVKPTEATFTWTAIDTTDGPPKCSFDFGLTIEYTATVNAAQTGVPDEFRAVIINLTPGTLYYYRIRCIDNLVNTGYFIGTFLTPEIDPNPPVVSNVRITSGINDTTILWLAQDNIRITGCTFGYDTDAPTPPFSLSGPVITTGTPNEYQAILLGLIGNTQYYGRITCTDPAGNTGVALLDWRTNRDRVPPPEVENLQAVPGDRIVRLLWEYRANINDISAFVIRRSATTPPTSPTDGQSVAELSPQQLAFIDRGLNNGTEYFYRVFVVDRSANSSNGVAVSATLELPGDRDDDLCTVNCTSEPIISACRDGRDNDADGQIDLADRGCENADDTSEFNVLDVDIAMNGFASPDQLFFWLAQRSLMATPVDGVVTSLTGDQLTIAVPISLVTITVQKMELVLAGNRYTLSLDQRNQWYEVDVIVPRPGQYDTVIEEFNLAGDVRRSSFAVESLPYGMLRSTDAESPLSNSTVTVRSSNGTLWPGAIYAQVNPVVSSGEYGFVLPNGTYLVTVEANKFLSQEVSVRVTRNVLNQSMLLAPVFDGTLKGALKTVTGVRQIILPKTTRQIGVVATRVQELVDDPKVEAMTEHVVAPLLAGVAAVAVIPAMSGTLLSLLRFFFLQPLLLVGKKKRQQWGLVYNSLTKIPVDLAMVRLIDTKTKRVIQSRVTDVNGRYIFFADPGTYEVVAQKSGLLFPSVILASVPYDGKWTDLYHGGKIFVDAEGQPISMNIPMDPVGVDKKPRRIVWEGRLRALQHVISLTGIFTTAIAFTITPKPSVAAYFFVHLLIYALFLRFLKPKVPKQWGTVADAKSGNPLSRAVVRLFSAEYSKLVSVQVTGNKGRYAFLVGPSKYYVSAEHVGHAAERTSELKIVDEEQGFVHEDIHLQNVEVKPTNTAPISEEEKETNPHSQI